MEAKLIQYKIWLNTEIENTVKKIAFAKAGHYADVAYWKGVQKGLERCIEFNKNKKDILNEITKMEKEIAQLKGSIRTNFLEGQTDALVRCMEKIED